MISIRRGFRAARACKQDVTCPLKGERPGHRYGAIFLQERVVLFGASRMPLPRVSGSTLMAATEGSEPIHPGCPLSHWGRGTPRA